VDGTGLSSSASPWHHFVNVIKSFIGSNYLSIPFAFAAAGIALGPIAVFAVAAISGRPL
jgi:amino acid permease